MPVPPVVPYSLPRSAVSALLSLQCLCPMQRRLYRRCAWRPLGIYHQHFASHLAPLSLTLSLSPSRSAAPDPNGDPDAYAAAAAAAERACFLMDFWLMFWALLWVPTPSRSHEPYSIDFQLRRGLSYATTLRWPNQSFDYRATTLDSKNILQHGTIYILYTVILYIRQWGSRCPSEARK